MREVCRRFRIPEPPHGRFDLSRIRETPRRPREEDRRAGSAGGAAVEDEVGKLREKANKQLENIYSHLSAWQKTQVARHPERPHFLDYVEHLFDEFVELAGDRKFMNDDAIMGGLARFRGKPVVVIGHEKGRDTQTRLKHNFGMGKPEGYRKAVRLIELAGRFGLPVVALVDTSGAFPGKGGEERGQAEALARAIEACLTLDTPMISVIVGEGGSGARWRSLRATRC